MTRGEAIRAAHKRWGGKAGVRVGTHLSSPEARESAKQAIEQARMVRDALRAEKQRRLAELDWLADLNAKIEAASRDASRHLADAGYYKFAVGQTLSGLFFSIEGSGDTWEEAFAKADAKKR